MAWMLREVECWDEHTGETRTFFNVIPGWGPEHDPHPDCWCEPEIHHEYDNLVVHREVH